VRGALQVASITPYVGGLFAALAGAWSEKEQEKANKFFEQWLKMLQDEIKENEQTIIEILARLDLNDEKVKKRIESEEYQSLVKKTFREWSGAESEQKREYIRNILANAASTDMTSDDVIRLFLDWLKNYSELHFKVIAVVYQNKGITRGRAWNALGKKQVREDSADADLYKLLIRDLSMGGIVRQYRETDYSGSYVKKSKPHGKKSDPGVMKSAFDEEEEYELTELGKQFVHYAMTDLPLKIEYKPGPTSV
jgi:hypothetical protein